MNRNKRSDFLITLSMGLMAITSLNSGNAQDLAVQEFPKWKFFNVAHRGGIVPGYPENTLSAFRRSISLGVDVIEIDLRGTRDGEVVVIHDETLDRTTNGKGKVSEHTLAELKQLDAGGGERIPTYREVLEMISGTDVMLLLDIKVSPSLDKH